MPLVQGMYANARSRVRVGEGFSKEFEVKVGVHQGSVLSPLLFIIVLEALSREFRAGVPWEDLYADDLVIIADSLEECVRRLLIWKEAMEKKGLRVNAGKTKVMICGTGLDLLQSSGECHRVIILTQKIIKIKIITIINNKNNSVNDIIFGKMNFMIIDI